MYSVNLIKWEAEDCSVDRTAYNTISYDEKKILKSQCLEIIRRICHSYYTSSIVVGPPSSDTQETRWTILLTHHHL